MSTTTMERPDGQQITEVVKYVDGLLTGVHQMVNVLDHEMKSAGLKPLTRRIDDSTNFHMITHPKLWMVKRLYRYYTGAKDKNDTNTRVSELRFIEVVLDPSFAAEPVLVLGHALLQARPTGRELWNTLWNESDGWFSDPLEGEDHSLPWEMTLDAEALKEVIKGVSSVRLRILPLVSVSNEDEAKQVAAQLLALPAAAA